MEGQRWRLVSPASGSVAKLDSEHDNGKASEGQREKGRRGENWVKGWGRVDFWIFPGRCPFWHDGMWHQVAEAGAVAGGDASGARIYAVRAAQPGRNGARSGARSDAPGPPGPRPPPGETSWGFTHVFVRLGYCRVGFCDCFGCYNIAAYGDNNDGAAM